MTNPGKVRAANSGSEREGEGGDTLGFGAPPDDSSSKLHQLYEYWTHKCDGARIPDRADLDPLTEIPRLLAYVWLADVEQQPRRYRVRLFGSGLIAAGSLTRVGQYLDELNTGNKLDAVLGALDRMCDEKIPFWSRGSPRMAHDRFITSLETLTVPLTVGRSEEVGMTMTITIYGWMGDEVS